jgi:hypothetical protein
MGLIAYELLFAKVTNQNIDKQLLLGKIEQSLKVLEKDCLELADLLRRMLSFKEADRPTWKQVSEEVEKLIDCYTFCVLLANPHTSDLTYLSIFSKNPTMFDLEVALKRAFPSFQPGKDAIHSAKDGRLNDPQQKDWQSRSLREVCCEDTKLHWLPYAEEKKIRNPANCFREDYIPLLIDQEKWDALSNEEKLIHVRDKGGETNFYRNFSLAFRFFLSEKTREERRLLKPANGKGHLSAEQYWERSSKEQQNEWVRLFEESPSCESEIFVES